MKLPLLPLLFATLLPSQVFAKPSIDVQRDCVNYRRLDQPYRLENGEESFGSMQGVDPVDEDIGICFAVTTSYIIDAWMRTYSAWAYKTNFRTSPIDISLIYDELEQDKFKREKAVSGSGAGAGFSFLGGFHGTALENALKVGVCSRENVFSEIESFN